MEPDLSFVGPGISLDQVDPIHQKRLLAFVNFWLSRTVGFLNNFAGSCEMKMLELERRIQQTDTLLTLLEAKLSSVPEIASVVAPAKPAEIPPVDANKPPTDVSGKNVEVGSEAPPASQGEKESEAAPPPEPQPSAKTVQKDPRYEKYFRMVSMGIPEAAVKQKMQMEGMDSSILENPNAEAPPDTGKQDDDSDFGEDSDSSASFSD